ncbi:hypothetical protein SRHO_G00046070 [Serrasalmus rhombeus]
MHCRCEDKGMNAKSPPQLLRWTVCWLCIMAHFSACIALLLLLIGQISAAPESDLALRGSSSAVCRNQNTLSNRLDAVEKRAEDTVQKLEEELAGLLDAMEKPEWSFLLDSSAGPAVDILDERNPKPQP